MQEKPCISVEKAQCSFLGCFNKGGKKSCNVSQIWFKQVFRVFFLQQYCWNTRVKAGFNWCSAFLTANTSCIRLSTSGQRSKRGEHNDVSSVQSSSVALMPPCRRADGRREGGGRGRGFATCSCLQWWLWPTALRCIPQLGVHVKIATPHRLSQAGETMPSSVLQAHPVKSAASATANSQSCFSHAHLPPQQMQGCQIKKQVFLCLPIYTIIIHGRGFLRSSSQYCRCRTASKCEIKKQMRILIGYLLLNYLLNHTLPKKDC